MIEAYFEDFMHVVLYDEISNQFRLWMPHILQAAKRRLNLIEVAHYGASILRHYGGKTDSIRTSDWR
jgi:hypothetical protein